MGAAMSNMTTTPMFEVCLPEPPAMPKGERERRAFARLLPELLKTHRGQFVAIHNEQVVDSGPDDIELIRRVHRKIGYVPICVSRVTDQAPVPRIRGPRVLSSPE